MNKILVFAFFISISFCAIGQSQADFIKKWNIEGYIYLGMTFSPEENEKNDYIQFLDNGTFKSIEEGKREEGSWEWKEDEKVLILSQAEESIKVEVVKVREDELILLLEEDGDTIKVKYDSGM